MLFCINATVTKKETRKGVVYSTTSQVPTFFLDGDIQGITTTDQAVVIATAVLNPAKLDNLEVSVWAVVAEFQMNKGD